MSFQGQFSTIERNLLKIAEKCGNNIERLSLKIGRFAGVADPAVKNISLCCPNLKLLKV